jgi:protein TonB
MKKTYALFVLILLTTSSLFAQDKEYEKVSVIVEESPLFPGCEHETENPKACADAKLFNYLADKLTYPVIARENGIEGRVIVQFIVEKDGSIADVKVIRGIGGGCDEVAKEVIAGMPKWNPGKFRGRPVRVQYTLPVSFTLEKKERKKKKKWWIRS